LTDFEGSYTVAEIVTMYELLLAKNLKLEDKIYKLSSEKSYMSGKINSLESEICELKSKYEKKLDNN
jgi:hypothetical protein